MDVHIFCTLLFLGTFVLDLWQIKDVHIIFEYRLFRTKRCIFNTKFKRSYYCTAPTLWQGLFLFQKFPAVFILLSTNAIILRKSLELWRSNDIQIANLIVISSNLVLALWQIRDVHVTNIIWWRSKLVLDLWQSIDVHIKNCHSIIIQYVLYLWQIIDVHIERQKVYT